MTRTWPGWWLLVGVLLAATPADSGLVLMSACLVALAVTAVLRSLVQPAPLPSALWSHRCAATATVPRQYAPAAHGRPQPRAPGLRDCAATR